MAKIQRTRYRNFAYRDHRGPACLKKQLPCFRRLHVQRERWKLMPSASNREAKWRFSYGNLGESRRVVLQVNASFSSGMSPLRKLSL